MRKKDKTEVKEVTGPTLLLVGFSEEAAGVVQMQLGRFGVTVITTGDCASATYVAHSADDLAHIYSQFHKSFTPPEPVVAEPAVTVATEQPVFLASEFTEAGAWGDEQR
jgi:hypothetical protein